MFDIKGREGGWREGRRNKREMRGDASKGEQSCGKNRFYLETMSLYMISVGFL